MVRMGFSLPETPSWLALSRHLSGEQKCSLHKGRPRRHRIQLPSSLQLPSLTMASFKATSALVKRNTAPATEKLQFIKPGIRRKRRRRGNKQEKIFYPKATTTAHQEGPVPQYTGRGVRAEPGPVQAITGQVLLEKRVPGCALLYPGS